MCFSHSKLRSHRHWNWDGDEIVHAPIVPSRRSIPGRGAATYDIDVREFLITDRNAVIREHLNGPIAKFIDSHKSVPAGVLQSRAQGSFDLRAHLIANWVRDNIEYVAKNGAPWQFPDETLAVRQGDCEDRALLLAALLVTSGISSYNIRVVLGQMHVHRANGRVQRHDHVWVMYKEERGRWLLMELYPSPPRQARSRASLIARMPPRWRDLAKTTIAVEYKPEYVFNDTHLWAIGRSPADRASVQDALQRNWSKIDPLFAGEVHYSIIRDALDPVAPTEFVAALAAKFTDLFGNVVDEPDINPGSYHPFDHFDNGYIDEGRQRVLERLQAFRRGSLADSGSIDAFAWAAHGIADFYAHSSYMHFAAEQGVTQPYDFESQKPALAYAYGAGSSLNLDGGTYAPNKSLFKGDPAKRSQSWNGKIITGRYAQNHDSHGFWERITYVPQDLIDAGASYQLRGGLPHHNDIAVDTADPDATNVLYPTPTSYAEQFRLRKEAAVQHIRQAYLKYKPPA